jgi:hypothetical protein
LGSPLHWIKELNIKTETGIVTNLQKMAEMLNAYFVETVEEIIEK